MTKKKFSNIVRTFGKKHPKKDVWYIDVDSMNVYTMVSCAC